MIMIVVPEAVVRDKLGEDRGLADTDGFSRARWIAGIGHDGLWVLVFKGSVESWVDHFG